MSKLAALLGFVIPAVGCGSPEQTRSGSVTRDSAGVTIVTSPGDDSPPPWRLEPIGTIGGADSGVSSFGRLDYTTVGGDSLGRIYVGNEAESRVVVFDSAGRFVTTLGRKGAGPGEFNVLGSIYVDPIGQVSVQDYAKIGLVRFESDGTLLADRPLGALMARLYGAIRLAGDTLLLHSQHPTVQPPPEQLIAVTVTDTTALVTVVQQPPKGVLHACNRYQIRGLPRIFAPMITWTSGAGIVIANSTASYEVDVFRGARLFLRIRRLIPTVPATEAMIRRLHPSGRMYGGRECIVAADQIEREIGAADFVPAVRGVSLDWDGNIWVERFTFPDEQARTDLFGPDGRYLGTFAGLSQPLAFPGRGRVVAAVVDSATDVARLAIHRIVR